nr:xylulose kinase-1 [Tanacetum cinerariifolium]
MLSHRGEESSQPPQSPIASTKAPQMDPYVKLPILKKDEDGNEIKVLPVTAHQILTRTRERKAKSTLLMAISDEHLARFHGIKDAKTLWAAIKIRFDGVSTEDANQKFLRSLPSAWINISSIMMNKPSIGTKDIDDLYNNLKVYEADIKGSSRSSSNSHNVAFIFAKSTSSTNELNAANSVSTTTGHSSQAQGNGSRDAGDAGYKGRDNGKRPVKEEDEQALVVHNRLGTYDWSYQVEDEATDFALMAFTLNHSILSSSNSEYLAHTDYALWEVILNGNSVVQMTKDEAEGLEKGYDRFQRLLSLLEIHRACVSIEDANQKFLRSLPSAWSNISLIMRNKSGIDTLDIDDMYNNLKVYKDDIKGSSRSSSNS